MHNLKHSTGKVLAKDWQKLVHQARGAVSPSHGGDHSQGSMMAAHHASHPTTDLLFEDTDGEDEGWASERSNGGDGEEHDHSEGMSADRHAHAEGSTHPHGRKKPRIFSIQTARRRGSVHQQNLTGQPQGMPFMSCMPLNYPRGLFGLCGVGHWSSSPFSYPQRGSFTQHGCSSEGTSSRELRLPLGAHHASLNYN